MDYKNLPLSKVFNDYIEGKENTAAFYSYRHSYDQLKEAVTSFRYKGDRDAAAQILKDFNRNFTLQTPAKDNLRSLSDENTVTITTGQQVSLFGGPLYTVFKTLSAIHLAKMLSRDTGRRVVPVFWLADEDHDFEEIATVTLPDKYELKKVTLPCDTCERHAAGSLLIESDRFEQFRSDIYKILPRTEFFVELKTLLDDCYSSGRSYRQAFGELLARLFSGHGLIFAGSNFREAKKLTSDKIKTAIIRVDEIRQKLADQSAQIAAVYHQQAHVPDSLLFWHDDTHGRVRLAHKNGNWHREPDISRTTDELLRELNSEPERFSPNVFLRPILQDALLPNAAYIGGPAEIAYFGQMKPLYEIFDQNMPFIAGRLSATLAEPSVRRLMKDLPYKFSDYAGRIEDLEQNYLRTCGDPDLDSRFDEWKNQVEELTGKMVGEIGISDPGLQKHSQAMTREHIKAIDKFRKKVVNAVRQKEEVQINRLKKAKISLFPNDKLQEREILFIYFMNKYGLDIWDQILKELETGDNPLFLNHLFISL